MFKRILTLALVTAVSGSAFAKGAVEGREEGRGESNKAIREMIKSSQSAHAEARAIVQDVKGLDSSTRFSKAMTPLANTAPGKLSEVISDKALKIIAKDSIKQIAATDLIQAISSSIADGSLNPETAGLYKAELNDLAASDSLIQNKLSDVAANVLESSDARVVLTVLLNKRATEKADPKNVGKSQKDKRALAIEDTMLAMSTGDLTARAEKAGQKAYDTDEQLENGNCTLAYAAK